jgi:outer membrane protein TolC
MLLVATSGNAGAEPAVQRLTLKDAIGLAMKNNNFVRAAGYGVKAAKLGADIESSRYYPTLAFEESLAASNSPTQTFMMKLDQGRFTQNDFSLNNLNHPSAWHDFKTAMTLRQPLFDPTASPARDMAEKEAEKEKLGAEQVKQDVAFLVFRLYLEVQKSEAQFKAAEQDVADAREHRRLATVRREAGTGLRSDELRARTHLSSAEQEAITAANNLTLAKMQLAVAIGLKGDTPVEIAETLQPLSLLPRPDELTRVAMESRNDLRQSRAELEKDEAAIRLARNAYFPSIDAFASYRLNARDIPFGSDNDAWMAGLSLSWQIFDGFRRENSQERAVAGHSARTELLEGRTREIKFQVEESYLRRDEVAKRLEVARHALLDAEETVRLLGKRYENSLASMVELLDAQTALNQSRANLAEMEANYALAGGRVYYATGIFLEEMLK